MSSIKSGASHILRSKMIPQDRLALGGVTRGIAATAKNATQLQSTPRPQPSISFISPDLHQSIPFQSIPPQPQSSHQQSRSSNPFNDLINDITNSLTPTSTAMISSSHSPLPHLRKLLREYTSSSEHWSQYAHANADKQYTRNLVCEVPGIFNLLLLVWTPGKASPVHDHADAHCLMKVLKGELRETRFATPPPAEDGEEGPLIETSSLCFGLDKVSYMADQLGLHSISNPSPTEYAVSLHLYFPPNAATRGCHVFDVESGASKLVRPCAYDSIEGEVTLSLEDEAPLRASL